MREFDVRSFVERFFLFSPSKKKCPRSSCFSSERLLLEKPQKTSSLAGKEVLNKRPEAESFGKLIEKREDQLGYSKLIGIRFDTTACCGK